MRAAWAVGPVRRIANRPTPWLAGILVAVAALAYLPALRIPPLDADNLSALSAADRPVLDLLTKPFIASVPGYRPVPYITLAAQRAIWGFHFSWYFAFNIALLVLVAVAVWRLVAAITGHEVAGFLGALVLLVDARCLSAVYTTGERQTTLACLFGATALLAAFHRPQSGAGKWRWVAVFTLLLLAALSKEFGLAFSVAVVVAGLVDRIGIQRLMAVAGVSAVLVYAVLRLAIADGAKVDNYCRDAGYFTSDRLVCERGMSPAKRSAQYSYNVGATLVGTFLPFLFNQHGALLPPGKVLSDPEAWAVMARSAVVLVAAVAALRWRRREAVVLLSLVVANAALSFMIFRGRNQVVGLVGLYAVAGIGLACLLERARSLPWYLLTMRLSVPVLIATTIWATALVNSKIDTARRDSHQNPCQAAVRMRGDIDMDLARTMAIRYLWPTAACETDES